MSRFYLVELEGELHHSREVGIFLSIKNFPGVRMVCDMEVVTQETLEAILLKPEPVEPLEIPVLLQPALEWSL